MLLLDGVHRRLYQDVLDADLVPSIPVQPISYGDAKQFLSRISGKVAPDDWQGQLILTSPTMLDLISAMGTWLVFDITTTSNISHNNNNCYSDQHLCIWK